jgi:beta-lactamase regulating signal transducer with metallopeptidase domain
MIVALAWNLFWQGAIIVALTFVIVRILPRASATTRYAALYAALLALAAIPLLTTTVHASAFGFAPLAPSGGATHGRFSLVPLGPLEEHAANWLAWPHVLAKTWIAPTLFVLWSAGACFRLVQLGVSLARIARIRRSSNQISCRDGVPIFSFDRLAIPIATGIAAPAIVLPSTLTETLSAHDLQCTVEHELAHVRRGDVLGNAVQRVLEALFFWNPWLQIVGRRLVVEREVACDDWAVRRLGAPHEYAFCLAQLARRIAPNSATLLTPSAVGSRNALVERIERLTSDRLPHETKLNYIALGGLAMIFAVLTLALESLVPVQAQTISLDANASASQIAQVACKNPNAEPQAVDPVAPDLPKSEMPHEKVTAIIVVSVGADGKPHGARVYKSSGNANVDHAVLVAAEKSTYTPRLVNCTPHSGIYLFRADFAP